MTSRYRFRTANTASGLFVIAVLLLLVGAFFYAGYGQGWFESQFSVNAVIPGQDGALGIRPGTEVRVSDRPIGTVQEVELLWSGNIGVRLRVAEKYRGYLSQDRLLVVRKPYGLFGDAFLDVEAAHEGDRLYEDEQVLNIRKDAAAMDRVSQVIEEVRSVVLPMVEKLEKIEGHIASITADIDEGKGTLGALISDEQMAADVRLSISNLAVTTAGLPEVVKRANAVADKADAVTTRLAAASVHVQATASNSVGIAENIDTFSRNSVDVSEDLKVLSRTLKKESGDLRGLVAGAQHAIDEIERLTQGLQKHWLVRKNLPDRPEPHRPGPADAMILRREVRGVNGGKPHHQDTLDLIENARQRYEAACHRAEAANLTADVSEHALAVAVCAYALGERAHCLSALGPVAFENASDGDAASAIILKQLVEPSSTFPGYVKELKNQELDVNSPVLEYAYVLDALDAIAGNARSRALKSLERAAAMEKQLERVDMMVKAERIRAMAQLDELEEEWALAASRYKRCAGIFQEEGRFRAMALSLADAGAAAEKGDAIEDAVRSYIEAARALMRSGDKSGARMLLNHARRHAEAVSSPELKQMLDGLSSELETGAQDD